jgi:hypothetical protein
MSSGAAAGAAAAAAAAQRLREEEEEMTKYTDAELQASWEFKILRSNTAAFKKPDVLRKVCEEEAQAGWILLEKFDNSRLRFKRPLSARANDSTLIGYDPYRTHYGMAPAAFALLIIGGTLLATAALIGLIALIAIFAK